MPDCMPYRGHLTPHEGRMLQGAVELAQRHWKVFPLAGKVPAASRAHPKRILLATCACIEGLIAVDHPLRDCKGGCGQMGHGLYDATTDVGKVVEWWSGEYRGANIGSPIPDPVLMIDIDPRHGGDRSWHALLAEHGPWPDPEGLVQFSGRGDGGAHLFVRRPPGKLSGLWLGPGIDLKAAGGYAVMAPSIHPETGKPYVRLDGPIPEPPGWFVELITVVPQPARHRGRYPRRSAGHRSGRSPADAFNESFTWEQILLPHGWEPLDIDGEEDGARWRHPDATAAQSATICHGLLFVYSTSTAFEPTSAGDPHGYTKFRAYAVLNHDGDLSAAARHILREGAAR